MFDQLTAALTPLLEQYGALGVFLGAIIEEVIAPIPSTAVILFGGFFLIPAEATTLQAVRDVALKVMIPASVGMTIGSLFPYYLARLGEEVVLKRFGKFLGVDHEMIQKAQKYFEGHKSDELLLFFVRAVPVVPSVVINVFCGLMKLPVREFLIFSLLGNLIRTFVLGMIGWAAGSAYHAYADQISHIEDIVLVVCGLAFLGGVVWIVRKSSLKRRAKRGMAG
jgi:membrane protein DedA with SNARE-associated domain